MTETPSAGYLERTEWNVRDSDATVLFTLSESLERGSKRTAEFGAKLNKLWLHFRPRVELKYLAQFLARNKVVVLNVAGSRESLAQGISYWVARALQGAIDRSPGNATQRGP